MDLCRHSPKTCNNEIKQGAPPNTCRSRSMDGLARDSGKCLFTRAQHAGGLTGRLCGLGSSTPDEVSEIWGCIFSCRLNSFTISFVDLTDVYCLLCNNCCGYTSEQNTSLPPFLPPSLLPLFPPPHFPSLLPSLPLSFLPSDIHAFISVFPRASSTGLRRNTCVLTQRRNGTLNEPMSSHLCLRSPWSSCQIGRCQ